MSVLKVSHCGGIHIIAHLVDDATFRAKLTNVFPYLKSKSKKTKGMHIKEIHAFHKFFEVVYNPLNVERTVKEVALVLKQTMLEKLPNIKFFFRVGDIQIKYKMALAFHCIKFPTLPSADFTLSFEPGYPWFYFGYDAIRNSLKPKEQQATWTKLGLHNYPKMLHYVLHQVRIERLDTDCLTGDTQKDVLIQYLFETYILL